MLDINTKKNNGIKVLSLFDGVSCARVALDRAGIEVEEYYASEIDKYAIQISKKNYPDIRQIGNVKDIGIRYLVSKTKNSNSFYVLPTIDLLIGGSPCQDLSIAKANRKGLDGERSGLFWEYVRILNEVKPKYFILENVNSMSKEARDLISKTLGVEPIMINASLVSAQNRKRLFWTNIPNVTQPEDRGILLKDIIESGDTDRLKSYCIDANYWKGSSWENYKLKGRRQLILGNEPLQVLKEGRTELGKQSRKEIKATTGKDSTLRGKGHKAYFGREGIKANCITTGLGAEGMIVENMQIRKLTPIECERLQGLSDNYTEGLSNTQRYKTLGNAFNCDVVAHILGFIPK